MALHDASKRIDIGVVTRKHRVYFKRRHFAGEKTSRSFLETIVTRRRGDLDAEAEIAQSAAGRAGLGFVFKSCSWHDSVPYTLHGDVGNVQFR